MITKVHIKNYRSLENVDLELGRLTVLVGRNGSGKSSLVDAIKFVQDALLIGLEAAVASRNGFASLRRWSAKGRPYEIVIEISVERGKFSGSYGFTIAGSTEDDFRIKREVCSVVSADRIPSTDSYEIQDGRWIKRPNEMQETVHSTEVSGDQMHVKQLSPKALYLPATRVMVNWLLERMYLSLVSSSFFSIYPNTMREPQKFSTSRFMGHNGENFSAALRNLELGRKEPFAALLGALKRVVDDAADVRVKQVGGYLVTEIKHEYKTVTSAKSADDGSPWFDLSQESDGTVRMLGLLVGLYQDSASQALIAVEEPEVNIHPGALSVLAEVIEEVSERHQVLLTTQSPDFISRFKAEDLRVVERKQGSTRIGPIALSQLKALEEELFTTGDLLRIEGLRTSDEENAQYA